jgi:hypothetical protein
MATTEARKDRGAVTVQRFRVRLGRRLRLVTIPPRWCNDCGEAEGRGDSCPNCRRVADELREAADRVVGAGEG